MTKKKQKKYYWLKLKEDFFRQKAIKKLRRIAGGDVYTIIYLKLQLLSLKSEARLFFEGIEDTLAAELALEIDEAEENVQVTITYLLRHGLIEEITSEEYFLTETVKCIGSESESAERVREYRERKALHCNGLVTKGNTEKREEEKEEERAEKKQKEDNFSDVFNYLVNCGFRLSAIQIESIQEDLKVYGPVWIKEAGKISSDNGKISYSYFKGILENWARNGKGAKKNNADRGNTNSELKDEGIGI